MFNYSQISSNLLKDLPERTKDVILRRFGLENGERETLEAIGKSYGISRERVRQIEENGFLKLKPKAKNYQKVFQYFSDQLKTSGNLKKEDSLLSQLGGRRFGPNVFFLLTLEDQFERFLETPEFYALWTIDSDSLVSVNNIITFLCNKFREINQPLEFENIFKETKFSFEKPLTSQILFSYLEISKIIQLNPEGLYGLREWPEINPKGVKDLAYLVFKKERRPLHFTEVTKLINKSKIFENYPRPALPQTVHNELIRDSRFVLVGRGLYALREWGYEPGVVKDIISKILRESKKPMLKEEIVEEVLKQRLVKKNTILLNLNNEKYFFKDSQGRYTPKLF